MHAGTGVRDNMSNSFDRIIVQPSKTEDNYSTTYSYILFVRLKFKNGSLSKFSISCSGILHRCRTPTGSRMGAGEGAQQHLVKAPHPVNQNRQSFGTISILHILTRYIDRGTRIYYLVN
ncbi:MAG: hypothetical protein CL912_27790 [Deltaproteobacteria bacterium]|nr:hypothetical protein [Deltaproteobacteria bacterium]